MKTNAPSIPDKGAAKAPSSGWLDKNSSQDPGQIIKKQIIINSCLTSRPFLEKNSKKFKNALAFSGRRIYILLALVSGEC